MVAFTRTPSTGINASCLRSPGSSMIPARTASWVEISISSLPSQTTRPAFGGCRPARQSKSCGWPLPSAPAMPTISPLSKREAHRAERLTLEAVDDEHLAATRRRRGAAGGNAASNGRPTISSTSSDSVGLAGLERALARARRAGP